jgi:hypothetical protein
MKPFQMNFKRAFNVVLVQAVLLLATWPTPSRANSGLFMATPFYGTPFLPPGYGMIGPQTGQMSYYGTYSQYPGMDMMPYYIASGMNWNGSQQVGMATMPPIGFSTIVNSLQWNSLSGSAY